MTTQCERCQGTGFEVATVVGPDQKQHEVARACPCRRVESETLSEAQVLRDLRIPPRYDHCTLHTFTPEKGSPLGEAKSKVNMFCVKYPELSRAGASTKGLGLLFVGTTGTGKTHLAVAALRAVTATEGLTGQFWDFHELLREIRRSYDPQTQLTEYEVLEPVIQTDVLVLDDLGAWKMTAWMKDTLFYVLNKRFLARVPTLITTNYPENGRVEAESANPKPMDDDFGRPAVSEISDRLVDRIGHRLRSRLLESCTVIQMQGQDWRHGNYGLNLGLLA